MLREVAGVIATSVALAPSLIAACLADATARGERGVMAALAQLGIAARPRRVRELTGGRSSFVAEIELSPNIARWCGVETTPAPQGAMATPDVFVLKHALARGSVLARGARLCGPQPYPADLSPQARIEREVDALRLLAAAGVRAPRVIAANPRAAVMLVEKLPGRSLMQRLTHDGCNLRLIRGYRAALDRVHAAGLVLNDAHPGNALVDGESIALIDFEFAEPSRDPDRIAFDLAYAAQYLTARERASFVAGADLRGQDIALRGYARLFAYEARRMRAA